MIDYEWMILEMADLDNDIDDCVNCPYAGIDTCNNQCGEIEEIYNPYINRR